MVDLESGETSSSNVGVNILGGVRSDKNKLGRLRSGSLSSIAAITSDDSLCSSEDDEKLNQDASYNSLEMKEHKKIMNSKNKHPKPPRPPMGASLDAASMRQLREMAEIAKLKRARIERMKALRNKKADNPSSSNTHIVALVVTILFLCIIIFQGMSGSRM